MAPIPQSSGSYSISSMSQSGTESGVGMSSDTSTSFRLSHAAVIVVPIIAFIVFFGGMTWLIYSEIRKRRERKKAEQNASPTPAVFKHDPEGGQSNKRQRDSMSSSSTLFGKYLNRGDTEDVGNKDTSGNSPSKVGVNATDEIPLHSLLYVPSVPRVPERVHDKQDSSRVKRWFKAIRA